MNQWQKFNITMCGSLEGKYWIASKYDGVCIGEYEWRQGWETDWFVTPDGRDIAAKHVTHIMPLIVPTHPNAS